jgi:hypothetical protein
MASVVKFDVWQNTAGAQYSSVIQAQFTSWSGVQSMTTTYSYQPITSGVLTITPLYTNSKFMVMPIIQGYVSGVSGFNIGIRRTVSGVSTQIVGKDGSNGDMWAGTGNGFGTNSYTISRNVLDSPGVAAGTPITYQLLYGIWSAGTAYVNYSGYTGASSLTILEIQS